MSNCTTNRPRVQAIPAQRIADDTTVRVSYEGEYHVSLSHSAHECKPGVRRIDKEHYEVIATGEVRQYREPDAPRGMTNLSRAMQCLQGLIRANFGGGGRNELMLTLTYRLNPDGTPMTDHTRCVVDWEECIRRLRLHFKAHKLDYIAIIEPQESGAWHLHVLLKSDQPILYISTELLQEAWRVGDIVSAKRVVSDDVGAYYIAYFTGLAETDEADHVVGGSKSVRKGARLPLYPPGLRFYRRSRGIVAPVAGEAKYSDIRDAYNVPSYVAAYDVLDADGNAINTIQREHHKRRRLDD